jgi:hypothetical protein
MRELLVGPEGNLLDGRDAQNVDFRNQYAGRSLAHSVASRFDIVGVLVTPVVSAKQRAV